MTSDQVKRALRAILRVVPEHSWDHAYHDAEEVIRCIGEDEAGEAHSAKGDIYGPKGKIRDVNGKRVSE